jgi:hypothetical protein
LTHLLQFASGRTSIRRRHVFSPLRQRFDITRVCVVADRGMIGAQTIAELEARRLLFMGALSTGRRGASN